MMENFFIDDKFYHDLGDLISDLELEDDGAIRELAEGWSVDVGKGVLAPMFVLNSSDLQEMIFNNHEERYSEDGGEDEKIIKVLNECVDFEKLNSMIPKLWYLGGDAKITKADLLEYIK